MEKHIIIIILALMLTACAMPSQTEAVVYPQASPLPGSSAVSTGVANDSRATAQIAGESPAYQSAPSMPNDSATRSPVRLVINNASMSLTVSSPANFARYVGQMADNMGGYVVSIRIYESQSSDSAKLTNADISIRVPAERLDETLDLIRNQAIRVKSENISGQDITVEYVDLRSRLKSLETAEARLMQIMTDARETEEVLSVFNQLAYYQEQIEAVKGQIQYYEEAASLSLITLTVSDEPAEREIQIGSWRPEGVAKEAIRTMIATFQEIGNILIWLVLCVLPITLVVGLLAFALAKAAMRIIHR